MGMENNPSLTNRKGNGQEVEEEEEKNNRMEIVPQTVNSG